MEESNIYWFSKKMITTSTVSQAIKLCKYNLIFDCNDMSAAKRRKRDLYQGWVKKNLMSFTGGFLATRKRWWSEERYLGVFLGLVKLLGSEILSSGRQENLQLFLKC